MHTRHSHNTKEHQVIGHPSVARLRQACGGTARNHGDGPPGPEAGSNAGHTQAVLKTSLKSNRGVSLVRQGGAEKLAPLTGAETEK